MNSYAERGVVTPTDRKCDAVTKLGKPCPHHGAFAFEGSFYCMTHLKAARYRAELDAQRDIKPTS